MDIYRYAIHKNNLTERKATVYSASTTGTLPSVSFGLYPVRIDRRKFPGWKRVKLRQAIVIILHRQ